MFFAVFLSELFVLQNDLIVLDCEYDSSAKDGITKVSQLYRNINVFFAAMLSR